MRFRELTLAEDHDLAGGFGRLSAVVEWPAIFGGQSKYLEGNDCPRLGWEVG